jgi:nucleoside-diphosphate-sugar epimerase
MLAHDIKDKKTLWESNVKGTQNLIDVCIKNNSSKIIFTSSNCIFAKPTTKPLPEDAKPAPIEIYGKSKLVGEKILLKNKHKIDSTIIRCPTIISYGRLGLLAILFEFIKDNKKIPVIGKGDNRYQFIYALDLACACLKSSKISGTQVYNIGSDDVKSLKAVYQDVIKFANSKSKVYSLPKGPTIFAMKVGHILHISPLGPYHYRMIAESFIFDTTKIKRELNWQPTKTNSEILSFAYKYYLDNLGRIEKNQNLPAHRKKAPMGAIKILKWFS